MSKWIKASGKLVYDPKRDENFKKTNKTRTLIINLARDTEIHHFYQWLIRKQYGDWLHLQDPMFGLHVTVVRGNEGVPDMSKWKKHQGEFFEFEYNTQLKCNWGFWNLPVNPSEKLVNLRTELGIEREHNFHLTVGRMYQHQIDAKWF